MTQPRPRRGGSYPQDVRLTCASYGSNYETFSALGPENSPFFLRGDTPSASYASGSRGFILFALTYTEGTSASTPLTNSANQLLGGAPDVHAVNPANANENVFEIRRITGLGWGQLAELLNVDRRTIHNWIKGGRVRRQNQRRIANILTTLRRLDQGSAQGNQVVLAQKTPSGSTVSELIKQAKHEDALSNIPPPMIPRPAQDNAESTGELRAIAMHQGADGSETLGSLPYESPPPSRRRVLRRD